MSVNVPFVDLSRQYQAYKQEIDETFQRVAASGAYVMGPEVEQFETELAALCETEYALTVANGTDALILAMKAFGIGPGDEVITAPNSFIASAGAIAAVGATIRFADISEDYNIDPESIERAVTNKTKAIMPIHLTGRTAKMDQINDIAKAHNLYVIEDAAQAIGAKYKNRAAGSLGDIGCFSLHPLKNLFVMGDGGFMTFSDPVLYEKLKTMRNHGLVNRNECAAWGLNSRLDTLLAAMGLLKLKYFDDITDSFRTIAGLYQQGLKDVVTVPRDSADEYAVYHNFVITTDKRNELQKFLTDRNIGCAIHYPIPLHLQPAAQGLGYKAGDFPVTERTISTQLSLPIFPELTREEIDSVIGAIREFIETSNK